MREYEKLLNEPTLWRSLLWTLYTIYFFWFLTLFTIVIKKAQGFNLLKSILLAFVGLFTFEIILLIFIR
jgi:glucan phosphoethanolaminetransferase (alkaline phosphatase superfamily)